MLALGTDASLTRAAAELGIPLDAARREHVANEQLRMVLVHTRVGTIAATLFALLAAATLSGSVPAATVQAWVAVKVGVALARVGLAWLYHRRGMPGGRFWRRTTYGFLAVDGAVWGIAGLRLATENEPLTALVMASLACITCVATFGLQVRSAATAAYVAPILLLSALGLALRGDQFGLSGAIGLVLLLVLQVLTAHGAQQRLAGGVLLRLQAQALADEKEAALQLARQQSETKSRFLAKISHELRTPLHGILGLARLVHLEERDPTVARRVELIEASGTHLLALINDLLDFSRMEAGRFTTRNERFELVAQCEQLADVASVRAQDKGLRLALVLDLPRPCWVTGDAARLRQVLHNLLGNAIKFTQRGGIEMRVARDAHDAELLRVEVVDTGDGIAAADLPRIFHAFHQSDRGSAVPTEGAGLGLTIAREIAQSMGGDITATSRPGAGSTFVFTARLPAASAALADAPVPEPAGPRPQRVLVAEDDEVNALIVTAFLDGLGIAHERVHDGRAAVGRALRETDRPDLVLMDWRMPVLDGVAATREIRVQEQALGLARVPIVALTAMSSADERAQCLAAGMDDVLAKPFTREQLAAALARRAPPAPSST
jgi:signal transduction histidine kinase/ActR/RegA family two-component response regulator